MNFLEQQQELASQLGLDQTQSNYQTLLKRWLNMSQRMIIGSYAWPFLRASTPLVIQTVPDNDYSTTPATVATVKGNTSITFSTTITPTQAGYYLQTSSSKDWYRIETHTAATAAATIDVPALYTNATATCTIRKKNYSLSADVDRLLSVKQYATPRSLTEITKEQFDSMNPIQDTTGNPTHYMMAGKDSSDIWQIQFWPNPDVALNVYIEYLQKVDDLSSTTDVSIIPEKWHATVMIEGAKVLGYTFLDDSRKDDTKVIFYKMLSDMKEENTPSKNIHRTMRPVDSQPTTMTEFPYPSNYPYGA